MSFRKQGSFNLDKSLRIFRTKKKELPRILGTKVVDFFKDSFRKGGFTDTAFKQWTPRWKRLSRTRTSRTIRERANLIKSGRLLRAVRLLGASFARIVIGTRGVQYAARHNEGQTDRLGRRMPKRKFIGRSRKLEADIEKRLRFEIDKVFNV